jgi:hypothetical protein
MRPDVLSYKPIYGHKLYDYFEQSEIPCIRRFHFITSYGCFQVSLIASKQSVKSDKRYVTAKFYVLFQDFLNNNYDIPIQLHMNDVHIDGCNLYERVILINGPSEDHSTYQELTSFIDDIYKIKICSYCERLYLQKSHNAQSAGRPLCKECFIMDQSAIKLQREVRDAFANPEKCLCRKRLLREFKEMDSINAIH